MKVTASETEVGDLAVNITHKYVTLEEDSFKTSKVMNIEKENNILKEYLEEERRLKDGAIEKYQFTIEKASKSG